jgi:hypothetical protein
MPPGKGTDTIIAESPKEAKKIGDQGYMTEYDSKSRFPFPGGHLVKDRSVKVTAKAPKEETTSAPITGDIRTPDKSGVSSIFDKEK